MFRALLPVCLLVSACAHVPLRAPTSVELRASAGAPTWTVADDGVSLEVRVCADPADTPDSAFEDAVQEVCDTLTATVASLKDPLTGAEEVLAALLLDYPGAVQERTTGPEYMWLWDPVLERWVFHCQETTRFELRLGTPVVVEVKLLQSLS